MYFGYPNPVLEKSVFMIEDASAPMVHTPVLRNTAF